MSEERLPVYEMSINAQVIWQAHSMSNVGSAGSNRLLPRRQLLADGTETDAYSGNIAKHHHAAILAEYLEDEGQVLCPACSMRDGRRAGALTNSPSMETILQCGLCDVHGFLVIARRVASGQEERQRRAKHSLIDFSFALALPDHFNESVQLFTRTGAESGDGQMLMKASARSGKYALCVRYTSAGIGVDTDNWQLMISDQDIRLVRHQAVLRALRDQMLSPSGALTAKLLPHLAGLVGAIVIRIHAGRAPMYSPLESDFVELLEQVGNSESYRVLLFRNIAEFQEQVEFLIQKTCPYTPKKYQPAVAGVSIERH